MAFKASQVSLSKAFETLGTRAVATKQFLQAQRINMTASTCDSQVPVAVVLHLGRAIEDLTAIAATPGLAAYASDQVNDPTYDVVAEFNAMRAAMVNARDSLMAMFPKDGSGFLLYQSFTASGGLQYRTFTAAQLAAAVAQVDSVIAAIA
jgi:hypothetical protein